MKLWWGPIKGLIQSLNKWQENLRHNCTTSLGIPGHNHQLPAHPCNSHSIPSNNNNNSSSSSSSSSNRFKCNINYSKCSSNRRHMRRNSLPRLHSPSPRQSPTLPAKLLRLKHTSRDRVRRLPFLLFLPLLLQLLARPA